MNDENPFEESARNRSSDQYVPPPAVLLPAPSTEPKLQKDENPFSFNIRRRAAVGEQPEPTLGTRFAINARYNYYTGTLLGSGVAALYKRIADDPTADEADRKKAQGLYDGVRNDLARYALMRGYSGGMEGAVAFAGQIFGGLGSPESVITSVPGLSLGAGVARRIGTAAVTQGAINAATDPAVQALSISAGLQKGLSPGRIVAAAGIGAVTGGLLQGAGEGIRAAAGKLALASKPELPRLPTDAEVYAHLEAEAAKANETRLDLAQDDPALLATGEVAAPRAAPVVPEKPPTPAPVPEGQYDLTPEQQAHLDRHGHGNIGRIRSMEARMFQENNVRRVQEALAGEGVPPADDLHLATAARFLTEGKAVHQLDAYEMADAQIAAENTHRASIEMGTGSEEVQFRRKAAGEPAGPGGPGGMGIVAGAEAAPNEQQILSLQDQVLKLADAIGHPVFQGRLRSGNDVLGQLAQGVARLRSIADISTAVHESAHYINEKIGQPLSDLISTHVGELEQFAAGGGGEGAHEGFAEFTSKYVTAPGWAAKQAPDFVKAFEGFMAKEQPKIFKALQDAQRASRDYLNAPTSAKLDAIVKTTEQGGALTALKNVGLGKTVGNVLRTLNYTLLDDKSEITRAYRALARMARDAGGQLPEIRGSANPEILARQFNSAHNAAHANMVDGVRPFHSVAPEGPGLRAAISMAVGEPKGLAKWDDSKVKDFSDYTVALRGSYLWRKFDNGDLPNPPMALSKVQLDAEIAAKEAANPQYREAAGMIHEYTRQLLRKAYDSGRLSKEKYEKLLKEEFYVPIYRVMEGRPGGAKGVGGRSEQGQYELVKRQVGSQLDIISPLEGLMTQTFLLEKAIAHDEVVKSFINLGRMAREMGAVDTGQIVEEIPVHQIIGKRFDLRENIKKAAAQNGIDEDDTEFLLSGVSDIFGEDPILGTVFHSETTKTRGEPISFYMDGGELRAVRLSSGKEGIALWEAVTELSPAIRQKYDDIAVAIGQGVSATLRAGVTTNPSYAIANFLRDQGAAAILTRGFIPIYSGLKGVVHDIRQTDMAKLYSYSGGISPGAAAFQIDDVIQKDIAALARKGWTVQRLGALKDLREGNIKGAWRAWAETIGTAETGSRIAVFENAFNRAKKEGLSDYDAMWEAAFTAKDLLDFGRYGSRTEMMRLTIPFLNAWSQAISKAVRTLFVPLVRAPVTVAEKKARGNAGIALGKLGLTGLAGYTYYKFVQDHDAVRDASPETRATNVVVPGVLFGKPSEVAFWPKPFELAIGWNIGEAIAQAEQGDERANIYFWRGLWEVISSPVLTPLVYKLPLELALNKSYSTGREITPGDVQQRVAAEAKASSIGQAIGKVTGWSPLKVDYAIGGGFGNWGRDWLSISNATDPNKPEAALDEAIFARRFIKRAFGGSNEMIRYWWDMAGQRNGTYATAKAQFDFLVKSAPINPVTQFRDDSKAQEFVAKLSDNQRVYVTMFKSASDAGKAEYGPDQRRLHPLVRASDAVSAINDYQASLNRNIQIQFSTGKRVEMDPGKRRVVIDALDNLKRVEIRNALVMLREPGFKDRKILPVEDQWKALRDIDPKVAGEVATRYASQKVVPETTVAKLWPEIKRRVLQGDVAGVKELTVEAKYGGYEFGATRVKKPVKPMIKIAPAPAAQPPAIQ